jgi:hypothetical protein
VEARLREVGERHESLVEAGVNWVGTYLIHKGLITVEQLEQYAQITLKQAPKYLIDSKEFRKHLQKVRQSL